MDNYGIPTFYLNCEIALKSIVFQTSGIEYEDLTEGRKEH